MQELVNKINESCFKKCAGTSGDSLASRERECLANCMGRYLESMQVVNEALSQRNNRWM